jgi:protein phosphatase 1 regulatory subunit 42
MAKYELHLHKVRSGQDLRTTLMIKNIPNKYDQEMLLTTIDRKYKGTYDFFYLPIDFKNKCNVGYAFINFMDPHTIAPFYEDFNNKKWEKFNSEKVCKITYARIQGKAALIDHFRNSSLMYEDAKCRPLIFTTYSDGTRSTAIAETLPLPSPSVTASFVNTTTTLNNNNNNNNNNNSASSNSTSSQSQPLTNESKS